MRAVRARVPGRAQRSVGLESAPRGLRRVGTHGTHARPRRRALHMSRSARILILEGRCCAVPRRPGCAGICISPSPLAMVGRPWLDFALARSLHRVATRQANATSARRPQRIATRAHLMERDAKVAMTTLQLQRTVTAHRQKGAEHGTTAGDAVRLRIAAGGEPLIRTCIDRSSRARSQEEILTRARNTHRGPRSTCCGPLLRALGGPAWLALLQRGAPFGRPRGAHAIAPAQRGAQVVPAPGAARGGRSNALASVLRTATLAMH